MEYSVCRLVGGTARPTPAQLRATTYEAIPVMRQASTTLCKGHGAFILAGGIKGCFGVCTAKMEIKKLCPVVLNYKNCSNWSGFHSKTARCMVSICIFPCPQMPDCQTSVRLPVSGNSLHFFTQLLAAAGQGIELLHGLLNAEIVCRKNILTL